MNSFESFNTQHCLLTDVMYLCMFRMMEDSRRAKGEVERSFYNIEKKKKKSAPTKGVSFIHMKTYKDKVSAKSQYKPKPHFSPSLSVE